MKKYYCCIRSNGSHEREYEVTTTSAMKCANEYGRCEGGEVVTVYQKNGKILSEALWTPENGGCYCRAYVMPGENIFKR